MGDVKHHKVMMPVGDDILESTEKHERYSINEVNLQYLKRFIVHEVLDEDIHETATFLHFKIDDITALKIHKLRISEAVNCISKEKLHFGTIAALDSENSKMEFIHWEHPLELSVAFELTSPSLVSSSPVPQCITIITRSAIFQWF